VSRGAGLFAGAALIGTAVLVSAAGLSAQTGGGLPLTLAQALEIAEAKSESVALARVAFTRNDGDFVRAKSGRKPQLSASATYERLITNQFQGVFDSLAPGGGTGGGTDGGSGGDGQDFSNFPLGRANTWRATLSFSQNLYSGGRLGLQDQLVGVGRRTAEHTLTSAQAQTRFDLVQAYYDAALASRLVTIAEATHDQADATLRQVQAGYDAGAQPEFEVLRARVNRDNQQPLVIRQRVNREVAALRLKQLLDLPPDGDLQLAAALEDTTLPPPAPFVEAVSAVEASLPRAATAAFTLQSNVSLPERNAVAEAQTAVRLREVTLQSVRAERKPTLTLTSDYSRLSFPSIFLPSFERSNWAVGANMSVPILTGGRQRGDEMVARADIEQARVQLQQVQELAALDTRSTWAELVAARAAWEATSGTVQQATRAYEIAQVRYAAGLSTQLELSDARLLSQQAEVNRAQAARDLQVARARVALLPGLPLSGGGAGAATGTGVGPAQPQAPPQAAPQQGGQLAQAAPGQAGAR
jgi:outer membrane protein